MRSRILMSGFKWGALPIHTNLWAFLQNLTGWQHTILQGHDGPSASLHSLRRQWTNVHLASLPQLKVLLAQTSFKAQHKAAKLSGCESDPTDHWLGHHGFAAPWFIMKQQVSLIHSASSGLSISRTTSEGIVPALDFFSKKLSGLSDLKDGLHSATWLVPKVDQGLQNINSTKHSRLAGETLLGTVLSKKV